MNTDVPSSIVGHICQFTQTLYFQTLYFGLCIILSKKQKKTIFTWSLWLSDAWIFITLDSFELWIFCTWIPSVTECSREKNKVCVPRQQQFLQFVLVNGFLLSLKAQQMKRTCCKYNTVNYKSASLCLYLFAALCLCLSLSCIQHTQACARTQ